LALKGSRRTLREVPKNARKIGIIFLKNQQS